jgi:hypothetical protein
MITNSSLSRRQAIVKMIDFIIHIQSSYHGMAFATGNLHQEEKQN